MTDLFDKKCPCCGQPIPDKAIQSTSFTAFWKDVPHKLGKQQAQKAWDKLTSAERALAHDKVKAFYAWFEKTYPNASALHPSTYLNNRRFLDEGITPSRPKVIALDDHPSIQAIKSGKRWLCGSIPASQARVLIEWGKVTEEECRAVGVL